MVIELGVGWRGGGGCNRVYLHIVFIVVLRVSFCQCSFVCGRHSVVYVCVTCYLDVTKRRYSPPPRFLQQGSRRDQKILEEGGGAGPSR